MKITEDSKVSFIDYSSDDNVANIAANLLEENPEYFKNLLKVEKIEIDWKTVGELAEYCAEPIEVDSET